MPELSRRLTRNYYYTIALLVYISFFVQAAISFYAGDCLSIASLLLAIASRLPGGAASGNCLACLAGGRLIIIIHRDLEPVS